MKAREAVSAEKLRGGFYTPEPLVDLCLDRIADLLPGASDIRFLEPSAGDGAFVRGIGRHSAFCGRTGVIQAIEPFGQEAAKCSAELNRLKLPGDTTVASAIEWSAATEAQFDAAIGNPPFVRFQFVSPADKFSMDLLQDQLGLTFSGVSNLWLPVLLAALSRLVIGGAFAFIVPTECFTGISAGVLRQWLLRNTSGLRFDLFPPGSFPSVLQEVAIMSGRRKRESSATARCEIYEHAPSGKAVRTRHSIRSGNEPWTRYLLTADQLGAFDLASSLPEVWQLGNLCKFEVAAVTGANSFFSVDSATVKRFRLDNWTTPLLPRIRHATGLRYTGPDHAVTSAAGARSSLLDFSATRPDPSRNVGPSEYLDMGRTEGLPQRFKCRIRTPWYRVPGIRPGALMMSKRSHYFPRIVLNEAGVVTTDTIYRGTMTKAFDGRESDLVSAFHNSLTLLSAEIEGRSFGGGVLELVPSEVGRLAVPMPAKFGQELDRLDNVARDATLNENQDRLVEETDLLLVKAGIGITTEVADLLSAGRHALMRRRLDRNSAT